jgi:hypothetical protein
MTGHRSSSLATLGSTADDRRIAHIQGKISGGQWIAVAHLRERPIFAEAGESWPRT